MTDASTAAPAAPPVRRSGGKPLLILVLLAVALSLGWWAWQRWTSPAPVSSGVAPLPAPPPAVASASALAELKTQVSDLDRVNAVLRQQVLALTERMRVLGDQVTTLQQQPHPTPAEAQGPTPMLALAEQWLELAQARFELFDDPRGALLALEAADRVLARARDPRVRSLRQTLAIEREALRGLPQTDSMAVSGQLLAWQQASAGWPLRQDAADATTGDTPRSDSGWLARLDRWFTVRPLEADAAPLRLADGRALVAAELAWARLLLVRGESAELKRTLDRLVDTVIEVCDSTDDGVTTAIEGMRGLAARLRGGTQAVRLGASLAELRSFAEAAGAPTPAAEPAPLPAEAPTTETPPSEVPEQPVEPAAASAADSGTPT